MDLRQLDILVAVAEHASFSAAARALHTVQSNVSAHIARLEREAGATLIDRARRSLTPEGQLVAERARRIQLELQAITDDLASLRSDIAGRVRLGVIGTTARWIVPLMLNEASRQHPRLEVIVVDATTSSLVPLLVQNRLDLAIVNLPVSDPDIETESLFLEDRLVIAPSDHPLASRERVSLDELSRHEILLPPKGTAFRDEIDGDAHHVSVQLRIRAEVDGLSLLAALAFSGFAPALLPATATYGAPPGGWRSVAVSQLRARSVGLATNRRVAPAAPPRAVSEIINKIVQSEVPSQAHLHPTTEQAFASAPPHAPANLGGQQ